MAYSDNIKKLILALCNQGRSAENVLDLLSKQSNKNESTLMKLARYVGVTFNQTDVQDLKNNDLPTAKSVREWQKKQRKRGEPQTSSPNKGVNNDPSNESVVINDNVSKDKTSSNAFSQSTWPFSEKVVIAIPLLQRDYEKHVNLIRQSAKHLLREIQCPQLEYLYVKMTQKPGLYQQITGDSERMVFEWSVDERGIVRLLSPLETLARDQGTFDKLKLHITTFNNFSEIMELRSSTGGVILQHWHNIVLNVMKEMSAEQYRPGRLSQQVMEEEFFMYANFTCVQALKLILVTKSESISGINSRFDEDYFPFSAAGPRAVKELAHEKEYCKALIKKYSSHSAMNSIYKLLSDFEGINSNIKRTLRDFTNTVRLPGRCDLCR